MKRKNTFVDDANGEMLSIYSGDLSMLFKILPDTIKFTLDEKHKRVKFEFNCVDTKFKLGDTEISFRQFDESAKYIRKNSRRWLTKRKDRITHEDIKREEERGADFDKLYELQNPSNESIVDKDVKAIEEQLLQCPSFNSTHILQVTQEDIDRYERERNKFER